MLPMYLKDAHHTIFSERLFLSNTDFLDIFKVLNLISLFTDIYIIYIFIMYRNISILFTSYN